MALKQVQVYCCTSPFTNIPVAADLAKVTSWSQNSSLTRSQQNLSNGWQLLFALLISITLCWMLYLPYPWVCYLIIYIRCSTCTWPSSWVTQFQIRALYMQAVFKCIHVLGTAAWKGKTSALGQIIKYDAPLAFHSKQNMVWNTALGAEGKWCGRKGDLAVLHSWKRCICTTHWMSSGWIHFQYSHNSFAHF